MKPRLAVPLLTTAIATLFLSQVDMATGQLAVTDAAVAQDPGVRGGDPGAGGRFAALTANQIRFFDLGKAEFEAVEEVAEGLGPRMNLDNCKGCHAQPVTGGSSPALNPQIAFATKNGGVDAIPSFIVSNGPVREARLVRNPDGTPDGGVANTFTISGRSGAAGCSLAQPNFAAELANHNVIFRIPTPLFGAGLIEQIPDAAILANQAADKPSKTALGIRGRPNLDVTGRTISGAVNTNGNDGTITRFGWKAQNVSLLVFSGEAYNVEMGITNELFQNERERSTACQFARSPNDTQNFDASDALGGSTAIQNFANFQRFLAPPKPSTTLPGGAPSIASGRGLFDSTGCGLCHTPMLRTGNTTVTVLRNRDVNLFSDLLVHDMGDGLADGVSQGTAGPREFRSAPLWGLGQRIFFLHDGRTTQIRDAITEHQSPGSEANEVIRRFRDLTPAQKQDLFNFLRSL
jgi:CxxC motif-containing protein (DUF1111 family)